MIPFASQTFETAHFKILNRSNFHHTFSTLSHDVIDRDVRRVTFSHPKKWGEGCPEGESAVYVLKQCTPLFVEKAGVAPDMTLRFTMHKQVRVQAREPSWL